MDWLIFNLNQKIRIQARQKGAYSGRVNQFHPALSRVITPIVTRNYKVLDKWLSTVPLKDFYLFKIVELNFFLKQKLITDSIILSK